MGSIKSVDPVRAASNPASGLVVLLVGMLIAGCAASSGPAPTSAAQTLAADPSTLEQTAE